MSIDRCFNFAARTISLCSFTQEVRLVRTARAVDKNKPPTHARSTEEWCHGLRGWIFACRADRCALTNGPECLPSGMLQQTFGPDWPRLMRPPASRCLEQRRWPTHPSHHLTSKVNIHVHEGPLHHRGNFAKRCKQWLNMLATVTMTAWCRIHAAGGCVC